MAETQAEPEVVNEGHLPDRKPEGGAPVDRSDDASRILARAALVRADVMRPLSHQENRILAIMIDGGDRLAFSAGWFDKLFHSSQTGYSQDRGYETRYVRRALPMKPPKTKGKKSGPGKQEPGKKK